MQNSKNTSKNIEIMLKTHFCKMVNELGTKQQLQFYRHLPPLAICTQDARAHLCRQLPQGPAGSRGAASVVHKDVHRPQRPPCEVRQPLHLLRAGDVAAKAVDRPVGLQAGHRPGQAVRVPARPRRKGQGRGRHKQSPPEVNGQRFEW